MNYTQIIKLDITPSGDMPVVRIKQGDASARFIKMVLMNGPDVLEPENGVSFTFRCKKPDRSTIVIHSGVVDEVLERELLTVSGNELTLELIGKIGLVSGRCKCDICMDKDEQVISTIPFIIDVVESPTLNDDISHDTPDSGDDQSGASCFIVTVRQQGNNYVSDRSFDEIYAAIINGEQVSLIQAGGATSFAYPLVSYSASSIVFERTDLNDTSEHEHTEVSIISFAISKSFGNTVVKYNIERSREIPEAWSIAVVNENGNYLVVASDITQLSIDHLDSANGVLYLRNHNYAIEASEDSNVVDDAFPLIKTTLDDRYDDSTGEYAPHGTFYFERIKVINGVQTKCQFIIDVPDLRDISVTSGVTVTHLETPISGGGGGDLPSGGGGMVVEITYSSGSYRCDKTFDEIYETFVTNKQPVLANYNGTVYSPTSASAAGITFALVSTRSYPSRVTNSGFTISKSGNNTQVRNNTGTTVEIPNMYTGAWGVEVFEDNGSYVLDSQNYAPGPYDIAFGQSGDKPNGCLYYYHGEDLPMTGWCDELSGIFPFVGVDVGEIWDEDWGCYVQDATFYFQKFKVVSGILTLCQFDIHIGNLWNDEWLDYRNTITYSETPINSGGGASIYQNNGTLSIS